MEDFVQVIGIVLVVKYVGIYVVIGVVLLECSMCGVEDVYELLWWIKVNELFGNFDVYLKNFSLLYYMFQQVVFLLVYDIVVYVVYVGGDGYVLVFVLGQKGK